jgi:predicted nuclease of predicted toxin-antitoxin system
MRFLVDMPVSPSLLQLLRARGHEGVHAHEIGHGRASDSDLMALARREDRVVVTADLHFPRLLGVKAEHFLPYRVGLFRGRISPGDGGHTYPRL